MDSKAKRLGDSKDPKDSKGNSKHDSDSFENHQNNIEEAKEESLKWRGKAATRSNYSSAVTNLLMEWLKNHLNNPYPSEEDRIRLCEETGLTRKQLRIWLIDARRRKLEKMKEKATHARKYRKREEEIRTRTEEKSEVMSNVSFKPKEVTQMEYKPHMFEVFKNY
mmetsp:Transcript_33844/g.39048  ORF Transcript_33844/g.39048 Transcript_33844/m.39048 type:complete len:165 (+) Transcript_33844:397-891(+)|eukprot:CAMPEP_0168334780 /NCGR_PEP_ID=MMETSP0213-20121227/10499_1 /TAXON_ID=151035 /ORGANISM="Euplotes harpa, Strain FSP1.4" /LENGTH=164 /DNA_ID=CAMNT_0008339545 /DNA_START=392 /DNA_END=886 /DNA_ORIENTATION=-